MGVGRILFGLSKVVKSDKNEAIKQLAQKYASKTSGQLMIRSRNTSCHNLYYPIAIRQFQGEVTPFYAAAPCTGTGATPFCAVTAPDKSDMRTCPRSASF